MKPHQLAFVGAGRVADVHYESIKRMPQRAKLVAVSTAARRRGD